MKSPWFKKLIPHAVAIFVFLIVALIYCSPVLEGKVIAQQDITQWKGAVQQSLEYQKTHGGKGPLWTNSVFSGMPAFQIGGVPYNNIVPGYAHLIMTLGLPKPVSFFFLASICFYFLCVVLRIRTVFGILGGLAYAYATYNPIIIVVGHDTKMLSMAYMPALLASIILIYEKRYWSGAGLTALFTSVLIVQNHPQIDYYFFLTAAIMTIFYAVRWIRNKEWRHFAFAITFTIVAGLVGLLTNAVSILSTYEYQKETIRGGAMALQDSIADKDDAKDGLTKDYAFSYSMYITEPFVMMIPRMYGGGNDQMEIPEEKSKAIEKLRSMPQEVQQFILQNFPFGQTESRELFAKTYWGGIGGTSGPPYVGAIVCFLAIIAMFVLDNRHKWWLFTAIVVTVMMSWGSYFDAVNGLLYKYLPLYNKFRAPSMILVIPQMLLPLLAVLGLNAVVDFKDKKELFKRLKRGGLTTLGVFLLLIMLYLNFDFTDLGSKHFLKDERLIQQPQAMDIVRQFVNSLKEDRQALMRNDILRSFGFIAAVALLLYLFTRNIIKPLALGIIITFLVLIDLLSIDSTYLNKESYKDPEENNIALQQTQKDREILADKSFFRVYNLAREGTVGGDSFSENITSYYYNSIGGYHPAKIAIYQELIDNKLRRQQPNTYIFDMLNTKYFIDKGPNGLTNGYQKNENALGNCWLVKKIQYVKNANEEMSLLGTVHPRDTALVQESFRPSIPFEPVPDTNATIALLKNDNDVVTYTFNAASNQFAVFSEVYYKSGWKAYIDGKEAPIVKTNYVLRGLAVPAGKHDIRFEFKPEGYTNGRKITSISQVLLGIILLSALFMEWRKRKFKTTAAV